MNSDKPSPGIRALCVLWPSFLMAGVMEMLVFSVVDPGNLQWFGGAPVEWSATAIYTLAFFAFWLVISTAGALTQLLVTMPADHIEDSLHHPA